MTAFRIFLAILFAAIAAYTVVAGAAYGWNIMPLFFNEIHALTWQGQFNTDFFGFLLLSGFWLLWRHDFSLAGWILAPVGTLGGMLFLSVYLLYLSFKTGGDARRMLMGDRRAGI